MQEQDAIDKISNALIGHIKWFSDAKGYGFIQSGGKDYFVHFKEIQMPDTANNSFKTIKDGQRVIFIPTPGSKGMIATNVRHYSPDIDL